MTAERNELCQLCGQIEGAPCDDPDCPVDNWMWEDDEEQEPLEVP